MNGPTIAIVPFTAWNDPELTALDLRVLLSISSRCRDHNRESWAKQRTIAEALGVTRESVCRAVNRLKSRGHIQVEHVFGEAGEQRSSRYFVPLDVISASPPPCAMDHTPRDACVTPPVIPTITPITETVEHRPENKDSPPVRPPAGELALTAPSPKPDSDAAFEAFWKAYPNKKSKGAARTAFARAIKRAPVAHLMAGLERAKAMDRRFRDLKFTPHASTWLNAEGFNDEHASHHHQNDPRHSQREHPKPSGGLFGAVMEAVRFYDDQERMGQAGETADERAVPLLPPAGSVG